MKRSERLFARAWRKGWMAAATLSATVCAGVWSVVAWQCSVSGGALMFVATITGLLITREQAGECGRLFRLARTEERWEWAREVRPRL